MNIQHLSVLLAALASSALSGPVLADSHGTGTSFIEGDVTLTPDPDRAGVSRYFKDGVNLGQYDRIILDPVEIWIDPDSEYKGIDPNDLKTLADAFRQILTDELEPAYPVVDKAGPGTMRARIAITGVKLKKKKRGLLGYTPIGFLAGAATSSATNRTSLSDAGIEAEVLDAGSGDRLGVLVDSGIGKSSSEKPSWEEVEKSLRFYAKRFRSRLDESRR